MTLWYDPPAGRFRIIDNSPKNVRLSCEVCGAHAIFIRATLRTVEFCATCGARREVVERRQRDAGHDPDRRVLTE